MIVRERADFVSLVSVSETPLLGIEWTENSFCDCVVKCFEIDKEERMIR